MSCTSCAGLFLSVTWGLWSAYYDLSMSLAKKRLLGVWSDPSLKPPIQKNRGDDTETLMTISANRGVETRLGYRPEDLAAVQQAKERAKLEALIPKAPSLEDRMVAAEKKAEEAEKRAKRAQQAAQAASAEAQQATINAQNH